jgi:hypothetical protein
MKVQSSDLESLGAAPKLLTSTPKIYEFPHSLHSRIMAQNTQIKTTFEAAKVIQPIFTRGNVALSKDGHILATCLEEDVILSNFETGEELARIEGVCLVRGN